MTFLDWYLWAAVLTLPAALAALTVCAGVIAYQAWELTRQGGEDQ